MDTRILAIEDNVITLDELEYRLSEMGYVVETAVNGCEAIAIAKSFQPHVILSDINLGDGIDGVDTVGIINKTQHIPVIYITAYDDKETLKRAKITDPYAYIIKPIKERELSIAIDIALYKSRTENELRELNALKNKFFSIIAHDLVGPFSSIYSLTGLLNSHFDSLDTDDIKKQIKSIFECSEMGFNLVQNLLQWSRAQLSGVVITKKKTKLKPVLENIVEQFTVHTEKKDLTIVYDLEDDLEAYFDIDVLNLVLRNLISNAIKFSYVGSDITIKVRTDLGNENICISVIDHGIGMLPDQIKKLFRIDENVSSIGTHNERGNGLGLILCKEFIVKHGGDITVESKPEQGSVFSVRIEK